MMAQARSSAWGPLTSGSRVVVLGGGPAGTACAIALKRFGAERGCDVRVTLLESKEFVAERHFNACVGVVSPPLESLLEDDLGVPFPHHLSRSIIRTYVLHTDRASICLDDPHEPSVALRRVQLDGYMLDEAAKRGVEILHARATDLEFHADGVVVYTDADPVEGDVVVGAFGLDEGTAALFTRATGYRPPVSLSSIVTKIHPGPEMMEQIGNQLHVFIPPTRGIEFGAITPKGNHLTFNIAGSDVDARLMRQFMALPTVRGVMNGIDLERPGEEGDLRFYKGHFPRSLARRGFGDRYVTIGDAAGLVRAFKGKGITSAVQTGIRAAHALLEAGVSESAFHQHYQAANQDIIGDLPYGQVMRWITIWLARSGLLNTVVRAAGGSPELRRALFGAASGHAPYRQVLRDSLAPASALAILSAFFGRPQTHAPDPSL
jgi:flavin-dependent dehydrogenase